MMGEREDVAAAVAEAGEALARLAAALSAGRAPGAAAVDTDASSLGWDGHGLVALPPARLVPPERFCGVGGQMAALRRNLGALAAGVDAHDMLLWGARGMGKSALLRSLAAEAGLSVVEVTAEALVAPRALFAALHRLGRPALLFADDLALNGEAGREAARRLRSVLDGGVLARPASVRLAVTSNHRHLVERAATDAATLRHARDSEDDDLALADRFGLILGFHAPDQALFLEMVAAHCEAEGLAFEPAEALAFALARGGRSGRTAWHFRTELVTRRAGG